MYVNHPYTKKAVKGKSIQNNLNFMCKILEGTEDNTELALVNLHQSKLFDCFFFVLFFFVRSLLFCLFFFGGGVLSFFGG